MPFVTTYHGAYGETNAVKRLYNSVMARGDVVIANSRYTADLIAERYGTPRERIEVIHRGVDPGRVRSRTAIAPERVAALRGALGRDAGERVILQAARLTAWKGQSVLIDAAARLAGGRSARQRRGRPGRRRPGPRRLRRRAAGTGRSGSASNDRVRLVGHVEDIAAAYLAAHVTVVASTEPEAFGRTAIEAAAMGCPVIATDIGAPPETVLAEPAVRPDAITGWLVPPGDAEALAERLAEALALAPAARAALAERARRHVLAPIHGGGHATPHAGRVRPAAGHRP